MTALIGVFALWVGRTPVALMYVRPSMARWLTLSGAVLIVIGLLVLVLGRRNEKRGPDEQSGQGDADHQAHQHQSHRHHVARVGWLLALPLCVAVAVGSNPLGSYAAGRQNSQRVLPPGQFDLEQYLTANSFGGQSPALRHVDFVRASQEPDSRQMLADHTVKLTGFVAEDTDGRGHSFLLTRFMIGCCAGDALAIQVKVPVAEGALPAEDTWVVVEASLDLENSPRPGASLDPPVLQVASVAPTDQPNEIYEYP